MKKETHPLSGILLINKPKGISSHAVVSKLRWCLNTKAIGHAGTLDPMAQGLLVCLIGKATKLSQWMTLDTKAYSGSLTLGAMTETGDAEGEVVKTFVKEVADHEEVCKVFKELEGVQSLAVPKFSAIKVQGKKLYDLARKGKEFKPPQREMNFYKIDLSSLEKNKIYFDVSCSKGTYIRSFAEEVGRRLESGAYLNFLNRTQSGDYFLDQAKELKDFEEFKSLSLQRVLEKLAYEECYIPLAKVFLKAPSLRLNAKELRLALNGQIAHSLAPRVYPYARKYKRVGQSGFINLFSNKDHLLGLIRVESTGQFKFIPTY